MSKFALNKQEILAIKNGAIILAQTDTTAGFLSTDLAKLNAAKKRNLNQPCIKTFASLQASKTYMRLPEAAKNMARKARCCTIAYKDKSLRIVKNHPHCKLLKALEDAGIYGMYSSSANAHGLEFCLEFAIAQSQFLALERSLIASSKAKSNKLAFEFFQAPASKLYKFSKTKKIKIR